MKNTTKNLVTVEPTYSPSQDIASGIPASEAARMIPSRKAFLLAVAVPTNQLDMSFCHPIPAVIKTHANSLQVSNHERISHAITVEGKTFTLPSGSSLSVPLPNVQSGTLIPMTCDKSYRTAWVLKE